MWDPEDATSALSRPREAWGGAPSRSTPAKPAVHPLMAMRAAKLAKAAAAAAQDHPRRAAAAAAAPAKPMESSDALLRKFYAPTARVAPIFGTGAQRAAAGITGDVPEWDPAKCTHARPAAPPTRENVHVTSTTRSWPPPLPSPFPRRPSCFPAAEPAHPLLLMDPDTETPPQTPSLAIPVTQEAALAELEARYGPPHAHQLLQSLHNRATAAPPHCPWTLKYAPGELAEVLGPEASHAAERLARWLAKWELRPKEEPQNAFLAMKQDRPLDKKAQRQAKKKKNKRRRYGYSGEDNVDNFVVTDSSLPEDTESDHSEFELEHDTVEEVSTDDEAAGRSHSKKRRGNAKGGRPKRPKGIRYTSGGAYIVAGPHGSGKSALVHAAGRSVGFEVVEVHSGMPRSGKDLEALVGKTMHTHTIGMSHLLILIEDGDVLFETDRTLFASLGQLVRTAHRPVVVTCQDVDALPLDAFDVANIVTVDRPTHGTLAHYLQAVLLTEGHPYAYADVLSATEPFHGDVRGALAHIEFQATVGLHVPRRPTSSKMLDPFAAAAMRARLDVLGPKPHDLWHLEPLNDMDPVVVPDRYWRVQNPDQPAVDPALGLNSLLSWALSRVPDPPSMDEIAPKTRTMSQLRIPRHLWPETRPMIRVMAAYDLAHMDESAMQGRRTRRQKYHPHLQGAFSTHSMSIYAIAKECALST